MSMFSFHILFPYSLLQKMEDFLSLFIYVFISDVFEMLYVF